MNNIFRKCIVFLGLMFSLLCNTAFAQTQVPPINPPSALPGGGLPPAAPPKSAIDFKTKGFDFGGAIDAAIKQVIVAYDQLEESAFTISRSAGIKKLSTELAWILGAFAIVIPGLKMALGSEAAQEEFLMGVLVVGFFGALQSEPVYATAVKSILSTTKDIQDSIVSSPNVQTSYQALMNAFKEVVKSVFDQFPTGIGAIWDSIVYLLVIYVVGIVAIFCTGYAVLYIILYSLLGKILTAIAIIFGPIFIAMGSWKTTRPFFDSWLKFLLIALFYKLVGAAIIALMYAISAFPTGSALSSLANCIFATILMLAMAFISKQIPTMASSLLPGNLAISGSSNSGGSNGKNSGGTTPPTQQPTPAPAPAAAPAAAPPAPPAP
ncbi:type IV secretion system protein [Flavobacterium sp.]|uniref:type IV secretion system protein n=1 Tax=Flavobacterium sp. TaxID=239 RepID=UPI002602F94E|nr:type IV secretion system protein [Flavobacterium sp.]